jgi:adenosine deaminase
MAKQNLDPLRKGRLLLISAGDTPITFTEALQRGDPKLIALFSKADRHCHSILSASIRSIRAWAGAEIKDPPKVMPDFDAMRAYAHEFLYPFIHSRAGFEFTAEQTILEALQDGVAVLEMTLDVAFVRYYQDQMEGFLGFVQYLTSKYSTRMDFRPEIGLSKKSEPTDLIALAEACVESLIFKSIDLYGNEYAQEPETYASLFRHAKAKGLKLKAHVGEFGGPEHIERTQRVLEIEEIQHGVRAAESKALMNQLRTGRIRLNVCPSSNVALSVARDLSSHQIRILVDNGVRVSINSDDKTIFGKTVSEEYLGLYKARTLEPEELEAIRIDSLSD